MEIVLIAVVAVAIGAFIYYNRSSKGLDVNNDGKVDSADVKAAVQNVVSGVQETADANKDGKVDSADVAVVKEKVKTGAKKAVVKAKETVAKKAGRQPKSKA